MKLTKFYEMIHSILDRRLYYSSSFLLQTCPLLVIGLFFEIIIFVTLNPPMLFVYVPTFVLMILVAGLAAKNYALEVHNMGYFKGFLFLLTSALASTAPFILFKPGDSLSASFQFILTFAISTIALTLAIVEITVWGQRASLRRSMKLEHDFFKRQKKVWEEKLAGFSNKDKITNALEDGQFIVTLFDRGSFNVTVLWSCNLMEKIVDAAAEEICFKNLSRRELFRKEDNSRLGYPKQLENLGFCLTQEMRKQDERLSTRELWHRIRNDIAHENYKPTFQETSGAIHILISFMEEMPDILTGWK